MRKFGLIIAAVLCLGLVAAAAEASRSPLVSQLALAREATGRYVTNPNPAAGRQATAAGYSRAVVRICAGALLFDGRHQTGTRSGAIAVSRDIRATGSRRLRRVDAIPKPPASAHLAARWIATERQLVAKYAWAYLQIWYAIERASTPRERAELPAKLRPLIHAPDELQRAAAQLAQALDVPDCTGGGHSSRSASSAPSGSPVVTVEPSVVQLHQAATVSVRVADAVAVEVRAKGASMPSGTLLRWTQLRLAHGAWSGRLGQPAFRGVYPLALRTRPGGDRFVADTAMLRVLPPGTLHRPAFTTPEAVVEWWVAEVVHGSLATFRPWPLLAWDRRDPRLHRLFVVAYDPPGATDASSRLGIWITAFRDGYSGPWRLLEATVQP